MNLKYLMCISLAIGLFNFQISSAAEPIQEVSDSKIEYPTPQAALEALKLKPGAEVRQESGGWIVINEPSIHVV